MMKLEAKNLGAFCSLHGVVVVIVLFFSHDLNIPELMNNTEPEGEGGWRMAGGEAGATKDFRRKAQVDYIYKCYCTKFTFFKEN